MEQLTLLIEILAKNLKTLKKSSNSARYIYAEIFDLCETLEEDQEQFQLNRLDYHTEKLKRSSAFVWNGVI